MPARSLGAAIDDLVRRFGGRFAFRESLASVDINAPQMVAGNPERVSLTFCNLGTADTYASVSMIGALAGSGIRIPAGGGTLALNLQDDGLLVTLPWFGYNTAGENVFVQEVWRDTLTSQEGGTS